MSATDVSDTGPVSEPLLNPLERRDPRRCEKGPVAGTEGPLPPSEKAWVMITPTEPTITLKRSSQLVPV